MQVSDVMTSPVLSVPAETPLKEVARLFIERRISGVPVIDDAGRVLGVVSEGDFLVKERGPRGGSPGRRPIAWLFGDERAELEQAKINAATAGEAMSRPPLTVRTDCSLREAAGLMMDRGVNRLPVVDDDERLVGIVTRADLVAAFVRSDEELARVISEEVVRDTMWIDPRRVQVEVSEGVVRLTGSVDRRSTAQILGKLASQVDGVVRVADELRWELDDRGMEAAAERGEPEPTAASLTARERHRPTG